MEEFETVMQARDAVEGLRNFREFYKVYSTINKFADFPRSALVFPGGLSAPLLPSKTKEKVPCISSML